MGMVELSNAQVVKNILEILIKKISRRTSEAYATEIINRVLSRLYSIYPFLGYIKLIDTSYSERNDTIYVDSNINNISPTLFNKALDSIMKTTINLLGRTADFFFIREFDEAISQIKGLDLMGRGIDLSTLQFQYIVERQQESRTNNTELIEGTLRALTTTLHYFLPKKEVFPFLLSILKKLENRYPFLKYLQLRDSSEVDRTHLFQALPLIDNEDPYNISDAIQDIILEIGWTLGWEKGEEFIDHLRGELLEEEYGRLKKIGVNLENLKIMLLKQGHGILIKKTIDVLSEIISTTPNSKYDLLSSILEKLRSTHEVFQYVDISSDEIHINDKINTVESYKLGKALRDLIKIVGIELGEKRFSYIEEFKEKLGEKYIENLEKLGVNLHFLEIKFS